MPVKHAIWKIADQPISLPLTKLPSEQVLEQMILSDPSILSNEWMLIGRQESTGFGGRIDLLAIAPDASLILIELKRDRTPRDVIAQALDYAAWVKQLTSDRISQIFERFSNGRTLDEAFRDRFDSELDESTLNQSHQIIVVASELDDSTERIITYLNDGDIAINAIFFQVFQHGDDKLLSRAWLIDPVETQVNASVVRSGEKAEPWNGEYYVSFGGTHRSWEDARKFGFISAGGGRWFSQTLRLLSVGDRVWAKIPQKGYVGVGRVLETAQSAKDFSLKDGPENRLALDVLKFGATYKELANDPERAEYFVRIQWLQTVAENEAINEVGLFGNQNTVCRPTTSKWRHTIERLKTCFAAWNS